MYSYDCYSKSQLGIFIMSDSTKNKKETGFMGIFNLKKKPSKPAASEAPASKPAAPAPAKAAAPKKAAGKK